MSVPARPSVERQVRRVRWRLFGEALLQRLALAGAVGFVLAALWFLVQPFTAVDATVGWSVAGALVGGALLVGVILAVRGRPTAVTAALALDERFALKERVTTLLTLAPTQADSPAGQALRDDVQTHVGSLAVASRFPLTLPWKRALLPVGSFALAVAAFLLAPLLSDTLRFALPNGSASEQARAKEVQVQLDNLRKVSSETAKTDPTKSEELKELETEWDKLVKQPLDPKDQEKVRERVSDLRKLEEKMKERIDALKEKTEKIDQLKNQLESLSAKLDQRKEGPARDFEDALSKGDFRKAQQMLEKLQKDLKENKLSKEQMKELAEQFKEVQRDLQRLKDQDEKTKQAQQDFKDGKIDAEQLQREMERNEQMQKQMQQLQQMADMLGEWADGLAQSDGNEAADKLGKMLDEFKQLELTEAELGELVNNAELLDDALLMMAGQCEGECEGNLNALGQGKRPGGKRPIDPNDPNSKISPQKQKAQTDPRGQQRLAGYARGGTFNKVPARSVEGVFRQSAQEGPEAIERQRIPDDAADLARSYFRKLGNQK